MNSYTHFFSNFFFLSISFFQTLVCLSPTYIYTSQTEFIILNIHYYSHSIFSFALELIMDYSQYNFESLPQRAPLDKVNSTSSSAAESTTEKQETSEIASQPSVGPYIFIIFIRYMLHSCLHSLPLFFFKPWFSCSSSTSFFDSFMNTYPIVPIPEHLEFSEQRPCDFECMTLSWPVLTPNRPRQHCRYPDSLLYNDFFIPHCL